MRRTGVHNFPAIDRVIYGKAASPAFRTRTDVRQKPSQADGIAGVTAAKRISTEHSPLPWGVCGAFMPTATGSITVRS